MPERDEPARYAGPRRAGGARRGLLLAACCAAVAGGCRSPDAELRTADRAAEARIANYQELALGRREAFDVERPGDTLRRRLLTEQALAIYSRPVAGVATGGVWAISLIDALQVGARNSKPYQDSKEAIFRAALELDLQQDAFRTSWAGALSGIVASDGTQEPARDSASAEGSIGLSRRFTQGTALAGKIGFDVVKLLTLDRSTLYGLLADATVTIPLLQGAGRLVVREALTQAERELVYTLWEHERLRRTYAVQVASDYFGVLQTVQEARNAAENLQRLERSLERARALADAGRQRETDVDQTEQDVLRARNRLVLAEQSVQAASDGLKQRLGLPVDARIDVDMAVLTPPEAVRALLVDGLPGDDVPAEAASVTTALRERLDLRLVASRREDAERSVRVAQDALRAGLDVTLAAAATARDRDGGDPAAAAPSDGERFSAGVELTMPWERTAERKAFRESVLAVARAERALEEAEDGVKRDVRDALRQQREAIESYRIQAKAVELAERRVTSTELFMEAGRAETRDMLEAEEALISAKNALTSALVSYRVARLNLLRDMGKLAVDAKGLWDGENF